MQAPPNSPSTVSATSIPSQPAPSQPAPSQPAPSQPEPSRRAFLGAAGALPLAAPFVPARLSGRVSRPAMVGSANALAGMRTFWPKLEAGEAPLDCALGVVQVVEADPNDASVGLGGLPNEDGVVQLDAACMDGATHNSGAVACLENILHPSAVARLVMERTDHCLLVGPGAYEFARMHGHPHVELLTERARRAWLRWKETMSATDDRLAPPKAKEEQGRLGGVEYDARGVATTHGTIHCSAVTAAGEVACTTTTSGLSWKIPGRVGDSPIVGAGLYCDQEAGSAGSTGRGEAAILANGSFACVELMRQGKAPLDAGLEVMRRIDRQVRRQAKWQPALLGEDGLPSFDVNFYLVNTQGDWAGVSLKAARKFAVADADGGPRHETVVPLHG